MSKGHRNQLERALSMPQVEQEKKKHSIGLQTEV